MLEDRSPPANPWFPRNSFVLVLVEFFRVIRVGGSVWLRQLAANDAGDVFDRLRDMIFKADRTPDACDCRVNEVIQSIP